MIENKFFFLNIENIIFFDLYHFQNFQPRKSRDEHGTFVSWIPPSSFLWQRRRMRYHERDSLIYSSKCNERRIGNPKANDTALQRG